MKPHYKLTDKGPLWLFNWIPGHRPKSWMVYRQGGIKFLLGLDENFKTVATGQTVP